MRITPIDDKLETEGAWFTYQGVPLLIARSNNDNFKKTFRRLSKPHADAIKRDSLDEETATTILCKSLAQAVLLGWDSTKFPGNVEYSVEAAEDLLRHDPDCRDFVMEVARKAENFYRVEQERTLGN